MKKLFLIFAVLLAFVFAGCAKNKRTFSVQKQNSFVDEKKTTIGFSIDTLDRKSVV